MERLQNYSESLCTRGLRGSMIARCINEYIGSGEACPLYCCGKRPSSHILARGKQVRRADRALPCASCLSASCPADLNATAVFWTCSRQAHALRSTLPIRMLSRAYCLAGSCVKPDCISLMQVTRYRGLPWHNPAVFEPKAVR